MVGVVNIVFRSTFTRAYRNIGVIYTGNNRQYVYTFTY